MLRIARYVNLLCAAVLVGGEFGSWTSMHPALRTLATRSFIEAEQAITRRYGKTMPIVMVSANLSCLPVLLLLRDRRSPAFRQTLAAMLCFATMLGVTFSRNMPLNRRTLAASADSPPADWTATRDAWDRWHTLRNALNLTGFSLLVLGALADERERYVPSS